MVAGVKFCGITRLEDAAIAASLGAQYGGMIFAGGPRNLSDEQAGALVANFPRGLKRVGVMPAGEALALATRARKLGLDVIQMHGDPSAPDVDSLRNEWNGRGQGAKGEGEIWAVVRCDDLTVDREVEQLFRVADAVLLDSGVRGTLGGAGRTFSWAEIATRLNGWRSAPGARAKVVVAGGLTPANVAEAIRILSPQIVDVASGVEKSPGVKDHSMMREFADAVRSAQSGRM